MAVRRGEEMAGRGCTASPLIKEPVATALSKAPFECKCGGYLGQHRTTCLYFPVMQTDTRSPGNIMRNNSRCVQSLHRRMTRGRNVNKALALKCAAYLTAAAAKNRPRYEGRENLSSFSRDLSVQVLMSGCGSGD